IQHLLNDSRMKLAIVMFCPSKGLRDLYFKVAQCRITRDQVGTTASIVPGTETTCIEPENRLVYCPFAEESHCQAVKNKGDELTWCSEDSSNKVCSPFSFLGSSRLDQQEFSNLQGVAGTDRAVLQNPGPESDQLSASHFVIVRVLSNGALEEAQFVGIPFG